MHDELIPVGIASAQPGWRAIFLTAGTIDVMPLAAWVLVQRWHLPAMDALAMKTPAEVQGVIVVNGKTRLAEEDEHFWCYLGPDTEDPDAEDIRLEMRLRRMKADRMTNIGPPPGDS